MSISIKMVELLFQLFLQIGMSFLYVGHIVYYSPTPLITIT